MADEVAEVDAGDERIAIGAGKRGCATPSEVGLQPFENFLLRFHRLGRLVQNNFLHQGNHLATVPSDSSGGRVKRR